MKGAFTLIELLVVISIIALLVGILLPALGVARRTAQQSVCLQHLRQISIGSQFYAHDFNRLPPLSKDNQGDMIYLLDDYISSKDVYICPTGESTGTGGAEWNAIRPPRPWGNMIYESKFGSPYTGNSGANLWDGKAYNTDYKFNDNIGRYNTPLAGAPNVFGNPFSQPIDGIIDRKIVELKYPVWTVIALDLDWGTPDDHTATRHGEKGANLSFLDGHAEFMADAEYRTPRTANIDPNGWYPWFRWGNPRKPTPSDSLPPHD
ncbi:type II secretion system protein [Poriferisphaera sp. WC338]|uniref:type II secretion system protein n=1 Tax=Poriferisphaera sp. WC338 TaxID=3425129 RepID=UPI003D8188BA